MTNIQFLKDRIIIDGHAETKQECETITLLCDNLAKSKDFKTVRYESGYAEFEKVGATNGLMFAPAQSSVTIIFDSHVTKIDYIVAASSFLPEATGTLTSSGQSIDTTEGVTLNCTLQAGYVIDTVAWSAYEPDSGDSMSHTDMSVSCYSSVAVQGTITITTKQSGSSTPKQTIDLSTLSGWANLLYVNHIITVKAKANGYADSAESNAVSVAKVASGYTLTVTDSYGYETVNITCTDRHTADVGAGTYEGVISINSIPSGYDCTVTDANGNTHNIPYTLTSNTTIHVWACLIEGTQITLADGTTKAIEDITYDDKLLVWNFYEGKFDIAKPTWIKVAEVAPRYNLVKFSNGAEVGFVGAGGENGYHRIFNKEAGAFTHTGCKDTPNGTTTFTQDETFPTVVSQEVVEKEVKFYNVITDKHYNLFANGILTSCKLSNKYRIEDMRYIGERLISDEQEKAYFERIEQLKMK